MGEFLSHGILNRIIHSLPDTLRQENVGVIGVDFGPSDISNNRGVKIEPSDGTWQLDSGTYVMNFRLRLPDWIRESGLEPIVFWRSSNHRCGAGGGTIYAARESIDDPMSLFDGDLCGIYNVWNPYGVKIEMGATIAQLCFTVPTSHESTFAMLKPGRIEKFINFGVIGLKKTSVAPTVETTQNNNKWHLLKNIPYLITFNGSVTLADHEVIVPSSHTAVISTHPKQIALLRYSCLGDPGYSGKLGMLIVPLTDLKLTPEDVVTTVDKCSVLKIGDMITYHGQFQGIGKDQSPIKFGDLKSFGLSSVHAKSLNDLVSAFTE